MEIFEIGVETLGDAWRKLRNHLGPSILVDDNPATNLYRIFATGCISLVNNMQAYINKNSSKDEIANVNFLTTISLTRRPTSKYRKRDKPTSFNKLDDR